MAQQIGSLLDKIDPASPTAEMASIEPSTDPLDLTRLPARLPDNLLERVRAISLAPLPDYGSCDPEHFDKCMKLLALLPRKADDEATGELRHKLYRKKLAHYPSGAWSFLTQEAHDKCDWFPTIKEAKAILDSWPEPTKARLRKARAGRLVRDELQRRFEDQHRLPPPPLTQQHVDELPSSLVNVGIACGALVRDPEGKVSLADVGGDN